MTRRSSQRALAREIYREMAAARAAASPQTPLIPAHPSTPSGFDGLMPRPSEASAKEGAGIQGDQVMPVDGCPGSPLARGRAEGNPTAPNLTEKVRALYEHSAVPVAEIAAVAGVTERTIYKYAAKERWTPRYRWSAAHPRRWRAGAAMAPVKGAGSRFIRRADKDKPFAAGLKATDPAAAAQAGVACGEAAALARAAEEKAKMAQLEEARIRALEATADALHEYKRYIEARDRRDRRGQPPPGHDPAERMLFRVVDLALQRWEWLEARTVGDN